MDSFTFLLDAIAKPEGGWHPIAKLGQYRDRRYGKFAITQDGVASWKRLLGELQNGQVVIDRDHGSAKASGSSRAAGWVRDVKVDGDLVLGQIEWTPEGRKDIEAGYYRFVSPEFGPMKNEQDKVVGEGLFAVGLTNRPFLRTGMPALKLSQTVDGEWEAEPIEPPVEPEPRELTDVHFGRLLSDGVVSLNWVEDQGGLPKPIHDLVAKLKRKGTVNPYAVAVAAAKRHCAGGNGPVWCAAVARWEQMKGAAHAAMSLPPTQPPGGPEGEPVPLPTGHEDDDRSQLADSRGQMPDAKLPTKILTALGLDEDADEAKALEAIATLAESDNGKGEGEGENEAGNKTLEQRAADEGKIVLSAEEYAATKTAAEAGAAAAKQLRETGFENAFEKAVREGRVAPATKDQLKTLYDVNAEPVLKLLAEGPQVVPVELRGSNEGAEDDAATTAATLADEATGKVFDVDPDSAKLAKDAEKLAKEKGITLYEASQQIVDEQEAAA